MSWAQIPEDQFSREGVKMDLYMPETLQHDGVPQKSDGIQVHHTHDGASWPVWLQRFWAFFTRCKVSHHDETVWDLGEKLTTLGR